MAKVIYRDLDGHSPRIRWHGVTFLDGQSVEMCDAALLAKAKSNRFFEVLPAEAKRKSESPAPVAAPVATPPGDPDQAQGEGHEPNQDGTGETGAQPARKGPGRSRTRA